MPPGNDAAPGGRTNRGGRIKPVKAKTAYRHLVQHRSLKMRVTVVGRLIPAMVIPHEQDDVRKFRSFLGFGLTRAKPYQANRGKDICLRKNCIVHERSFKS